jgi:uncharacterized repeat protein (TIGR03803 family)
MDTTAGLRAFLATVGFGLGGVLTAHATDRYDPVSGQLTIPAMQVGTASYANLVVTPAKVVSILGSVPIGSVDRYDPANNQLHIPSVVVGGTAAYDNVVIDVGSLVSVAGVTGVDTYDGNRLTIPSVQVRNGSLYANVVVTVGEILSAGGGLPRSVRDQYEPSTGQLTIAAVQLGAHVYTNPVITIGSIVTVGGVLPTESVLYAFGATAGGSAGIDAADPVAPLVRAGDGNFYGTTIGGGQYAGGTVYRVTPGGAETVLHAFGNGTDAANPAAGLIVGSDGALYGTAEYGGTYGQGGVFRITTAGSESVLYSFSGGGGRSGSLDGANPEGALTLSADGSFYGTTSYGGQYGSGAVFRIAPDGAESVLYSFSGEGGIPGSTDAAAPESALLVGADGSLYGTSSAGGDHDAGTVFRVTTAGAETVLYSFSGSAVAGSPDGAAPVAALLLGADGNFYGTTPDGGTAGKGTVFRLTPSGSETVLYSFSGGDGANPLAGLIEGSDGNLYGTTQTGGPDDTGTVFRLTTGGTLTSLVAFAAAGGSDGGRPSASLVEGAGGVLYGVTELGGANNAGTVFRIANALVTP